MRSAGTKPRTDIATLRDRVGVRSSMPSPFSNCRPGYLGNFGNLLKWRHGGAAIKGAARRATGMSADPALSSVSGGLESHTSFVPGRFGHRRARALARRLPPQIFQSCHRILPGGRLSLIINHHQAISRPGASGRYSPHEHPQRRAGPGVSGSFRWVTVTWASRIVFDASWDAQVSRGHAGGT